MTTRRYPRTMHEAFPQYEAWRGVVTRYRRPLAERLTELIKTLAVLALFALIGAMMAGCAVMTIPLPDPEQVVDQQRKDADMQACARESMDATYSAEPPAKYRGLSQRQVWVKCLTDKGYRVIG